MPRRGIQLIILGNIEVLKGGAQGQMGRYDIFVILLNLRISVVSICWNVAIRSRENEHLTFYYYFLVAGFSTI